MLNKRSIMKLCLPFCMPSLLALGLLLPAAYVRFFLYTKESSHGEIAVRYGGNV